jgi:hypothetical protein
MMTIYRQDAIKGVKELFACADIGNDECDITYMLENLPSADRPTGKCKDCTHWDKLDYEAPRQGWCYQFEEFTDADEYCSRCAMMRGDSDG